MEQRFCTLFIYATSSAICLQCIDVAYCHRCPMQHALCVVHTASTRSICAKNGRSNWDVTWEMVSREPKEPSIRWRSRSPQKGELLRRDMPANCASGCLLALLQHTCKPNPDSWTCVATNSNAAFCQFTLDTCYHVYNKKFQTSSARAYFEQLWH